MNSEQIPAGEYGEPQQPNLEDINNFMSAVSSFNASERENGRDPLGLNESVERMQRDDAVEKLIAQGASELEAIANVETIEASGGTNIERETLYLFHGNTMEQTGLTITATGTATVLVRDGMLLNHALQAAEGEPTPELANNLQQLFDGYLVQAQSYGAHSHETEVDAILRDKKPEWWFPDYDLAAEDVHSLEQITANAGDLSQRLIEQGLDPVYASYVHNTGTYIQEGDLVPWAIAGEYGLLPETASGHNVLAGNSEWLNWDTEDAWEPAFLALANANPNGQFHENFRAQLIANTDLLAAQCQSTIDESYEEYAVRDMKVDEEHRQKIAEDGFEDDDFDHDSMVMTTEEERRQSYANDQEWARRQLPMLQAVRARLEATTAA